MKVTFENWFRGALIILFILAMFGLWANAQSATNPPTPPAVQQAAAERTFDDPYLTFGLDRLAPLKRTVFGEPLWKYVASLVYIFLAFLIARIVDWFSCLWFKKWASKTATRMDDVLLTFMRGPTKVIAFVILLHIGLNFFNWPGRIQVYLSRALTLIVAGALTYVAIKLVNLSLDFWRRRQDKGGDAGFNNQLFSILRKSLNAFVIVVAVLVTAQNIGINITAVITSLSIGGLAVGLAAQDTLANLFGAVAVFADRPFNVGDQIKILDIEGVVESVGMRSTRVRNSEGHLIAIPNKTVGNANISNITRRSDIKTVMNFALAHDLPSPKVKQALEILAEIYRKHPSTKDAWISFNQFAGRNINLMVVHWWKGTDYQSYLSGIQEMNLAVKDRFDAEGIRFA